MTRRLFVKDAGHERGFSIVEVGIALAIMSVLVVGVIISQGFRESARVSNTVRQILDIQKAAYQYSYRYRRGLDYSGLSNAELLASGGATINTSKPLYDAPLETAWGQPVTLAQDPADRTYFIMTIPVPDGNIKADLKASVAGVGQDVSSPTAFEVKLRLRGRPEGM